MRRFRAAVHDELHAMGALDRGRQAARKQMGIFALVILIASGVLFLVAAFLTREYRAWPLAVPAAFTVSSLIGFLVYGAMTPLSDAGVSRAARWRAYQQHLNEVARGHGHLVESSSAVLPFAVALGLGSAWAKYVKLHPFDVPPWFSAVSQSSDVFPAFVAFAGSSGGAATGASATGAAGGGASGAS